MQNICKYIILILLCILPFTDLISNITEVSGDNDSAISLLIRGASLGIMIVYILMHIDCLIRLFYNRVAVAGIILLLYIFFHILLLGDIRNDIVPFIKIAYGLISFMFFYVLSVQEIFNENDYKRLFFLFIIIVLTTILAYVDVRSTLRVKGLAGLADNRGYTIVSCIPVILLFKNKKNIFTFLLLLATVGVIISGKRGALIIWGIMLFFTLRTYFSKAIMSRIAKQYTLLGVIVLVSLLAIVFNDFVCIAINRMLNIKGSGGSGRDMIYKIYLNGWYSSSDFALIFGNGLFSATEKLSISKMAHNDWLQMMYDFGILGILFFTNLIYQLISYCKRIRYFNPIYFIMFLLLIVHYIIKSMISGVFFMDSYNTLLYIQFAYILAQYDNKNYKINEQITSEI